MPSIGDYGIIGNCRSAALVSKSGSIDWLCWPHFSAEPLFFRLLDGRSGGRWSITPREPFSCTRRYIGKTNVLETTFETSDGTAIVIDFMPVGDEEYNRTHLTAEHQVTRIVRCEAGTMDLDVRFAPRSGFHSKPPQLIDHGKLGLRAELRCGMLALHSNANWNTGAEEAVSLLCMRAGDSQAFELTLSTEAPALIASSAQAFDAMERTIAWWEGWSAQLTYKGPYRGAVQRSLLVLKLLQYAPTGAFVAAATTSLPEKAGGKLNWDYRYCWLRDASFNVQALCQTGYGKEAAAFLEWMLHATRLTQPKLMTMYDLFGNPTPTEVEVSGLAGFGGATPVRTGNMAGEQHQLDTYGEVICAAAQIIKSNKFADKETQNVLTSFGLFVAKHWKDPDAGIWESRDKPVTHTHSHLLCWVAMDELLKLGEGGLLSGIPTDLFRETREEIRTEIEQHCWSHGLNSYVSEPGGSQLDAVLLLFALHAFKPPDDSRLQATYREISKRLQAGETLLYRNLPENGISEENAFGICAFWAIEFLAMGGGSLPTAKTKFEKMLSYANDLGLFAEEMEPTSGTPIGNFPQTFTHVGLINAALAIGKRGSRLEETPCT